MIFKNDKYNQYNQYRWQVSRKHAELEDSNRFAIISMYVFTGIIVLAFFMILLG